MPGNIETRAGGVGESPRQITLNISGLIDYVNTGDSFYAYYPLEGGSVNATLLQVESISDGVVNLNNTITTGTMNPLVVSKINVGDITYEELSSAVNNIYTSPFYIDGNIVAYGINSDSSGDFLNLPTILVSVSKTGIYQNGKSITPKISGQNVSRVMYNGWKVFPSLNKLTFTVTCTNQNPEDVMLFLYIDGSSYGRAYLDTPVTYEYQRSNETHTFGFNMNYTASDKKLEIDGIDISNYLTAVGCNNYTFSCETDHTVVFSYNERGIPTP